MFQPTNESFVRSMVEATLADDAHDDAETRALRQGLVYRPRANRNVWQLIHTLGTRLRGPRRTSARRAITPTL